MTVLLVLGTFAVFLIVDFFTGKLPHVSNDNDISHEIDVVEPMPSLSRSAGA